MKTTHTIFALSFLLIFTTACSQNPLSAGMGFGTWDPGSTGIDPLANITAIPYALLSSEQMLKSMSSVTGTAISGATMTEYNNRQAVFAGGYDLKAVTSPMLIGVTNLASVFCNDTLTRESALPSGQRKLFNEIDFSRNVRSLTDSQFASAAERLSKAFWGRRPNSEELVLLADGKNEFVAALTTAESNAVVSSRNLMLFTCTAMLSSFDAYQF